MNFSGLIPSSKSEWIRAEVLRSFEPEFKIVPESIEAPCNDVLLARNATDAILLEKGLRGATDGLEIDCGHSAAVLRFYALRVSRLTGVHRLLGSERLFKRPHHGLFEILKQLGVKYEFNFQGLTIYGKSWSSNHIEVGTQDSSQFLSALLLSSIDLPNPVYVSTTGLAVSRGYVDLTLELLRSHGIGVVQLSRPHDSILYIVPANSRLRDLTRILEPDYSSAFAMAAIAAVCGRACFRRFGTSSLQPDFRFLDILSKMNAKVWRSGSSVVVERASKLRAIEVDLTDAPDLFPVLAALCGFAEGRSRLYGAHHLAGKESNRIELTSSLLKLCKIEHTVLPDGIEVSGMGTVGAPAQREPITFNPENDHRMAMAAGLLRTAGFPITIESPDVVDKSYPGFWHELDRAIRSGADSSSEPVPYYKAKLLIGHRGTGKTRLLEQLRHAKYSTLDLDNEIEKRSQKSITQIFELSGEEAFRNLECEVLRDVLQMRTAEYIALGAGFELDRLDSLLKSIGVDRESIDILWIKRITDADGRIFLDRPRLDHKKHPLEEYRSRYQSRTDRFARYANRELEIPEGGLPNLDYFSSSIRRSMHGGCTLLPRDLDRLEDLNTWPVDFFEIRTDQWTLIDIKRALEKFDVNRLLVSIRTPNFTTFNWPVRYDWALELGPVPETLRDHCYSVSLHESQEVSRFSEAPPQARLKLAPVVQSFEELERLHQWALQDRDRRNFLPRSTGETPGRWIWYRLWTKALFEIQFFREGNSVQLDLPSMIEWVAQDSHHTGGFGAVLGWPVRHSLSPSTHRDFARKIGTCGFYAIEISKLDWNAKSPALEVLRRLGLRYAAVTSPLKKLAATIQAGPYVEAFRDRVVLAQQSCNTLACDRKSNKWFGTNTDIDGVRAISRNIADDMSIAVWGGGGMLAPLKLAFPHASYYSARTGLLREVHSEKLESPQILIWAAPSLSGLAPPPAHWQPKRVIDLSYSDSSEGRAYAMQIGAQYLSGIELFKTQALSQQRFWSLFADEWFANEQNF